MDWEGMMEDMDWDGDKPEGEKGDKPEGEKGEKPEGEKPEGEETMEE